VVTECRRGVRPTERHHQRRDWLCRKRRFHCVDLRRPLHQRSQRDGQHHEPHSDIYDNEFFHIIIFTVGLPHLLKILHSEFPVTVLSFDNYTQKIRKRRPRRSFSSWRLGAGRAFGGTPNAGVETTALPRAHVCCPSNTRCENNTGRCDRRGRRSPHARARMLPGAVKFAGLGEI
jgi:hypothetical protein